ncbi:hypothetical protein [Chlorogloea sp. CCALA 695]|uniref:hypothetical protein n=1 Tax=Chlorogloea sp. CCALA 695 TaxID=2107693 RepID=UPI000D0742F2|nr:hypothetical protein [Chlorogloea sp. CCALA 695]PSB31323.1 hypothetical protein C7B70_13385 [Chlorogloea sp. CCALA 695]
MRSRYQRRIQQYNPLVVYAQEQLFQGNALLVDESSDNQQFATNLLEMRSHYQATVDEQKRSSGRQSRGGWNSNNIALIPSPLTIPAALTEEIGYTKQSYYLPANPLLAEKSNHLINGYCWLYKA